jgi:tetratricopeptide (TPR) repeat protein
MTTTLTHPAAEDLGRFIEGTLGEPERAAVVEHVADCDDCRIIVVDATEFFAKEHPVSQSNARWWMAAAAAVAIAVAGVWLVDARRDPLAPVREASTKLQSRLVAARLSGFAYAPTHTMRGPSETIDLAAYQVAAKADEVLQQRGDNSRMLHAKGVALLLKVEAELPELTANNAQDNEAREELVKQRNEAVAKLQAAADREPDNAAFQSDLAAALIATGDAKNINLAADICNRLVQRTSPSLEALFNRATALDLARKTPDAIAAYQSYLKADSKSEWAKEARDRVSSLQEELKPLP